jgi:uroporphyrinogen decarboxylase
MTTMTPRQRVLAAVNREQPDRVPYKLSWGSFTPALIEVFRQKTGAEDPLEYFFVPVRPVAHRGRSKEELWQTYSRYYPGYFMDEVEIGDFGVASLPGSLLHFRRDIHPLAAVDTVNAIIDYPFPDPLRPETCAHLAAETERNHARNLAVNVILCVTIFEVAWAIRSVEALFTDIALRPDLASALLDRMTVLRLVQARQLVEAGVDILSLGDDISTQRGLMMSPAMWRQWFKPRLAAIIAEARRLRPGIPVFYHSDGDCRAIIPELIEIGITILNPVQPECMDPTEIKRQ